MEGELLPNCLGVLKQLVAILSQQHERRAEVDVQGHVLEADLGLRVHFTELGTLAKTIILAVS